MKEVTIYSWPESQNCLECRHGEFVQSETMQNGEHICNINCKENDGINCPSKASLIEVGIIHIGYPKIVVSVKAGTILSDVLDYVNIDYQNKLSARLSGNIPIIPFDTVISEDQTVILCKKQEILGD